MGPQAAAGRALYDLAVMDRPAATVAQIGGGGAALLERTQICHSVALAGLLPCIGGVAALLPLVAQLDLPARSDCTLHWSAGGGRNCISPLEEAAPWHAC